MSKPKTAKDIKEATKILSYLGRAEKYFDLELVKNGRPVKPLLMIADIIDPLRQISEVAARVENNSPLPHYSAEAFENAARICEVCDDIIALNPRGLVASDKATLTRLKSNIAAVQEKAALDPDFADGAPQTREQPVQQSQAPQPQPQVFAQAVQAQQQAPQPAAYQAEFNARVVEQYQFPQEPVYAAAGNKPMTYNYEAPAQPQFYGEPQAYEQNFSNQNFNDRYSVTDRGEQHRFNDGQDYAPQGYQQPAQPQQQAGQLQEAKIYQIHPAKREADIGGESYLATTYPGMNLQEAANIISELAGNSKNHSLVLLEHSSQIKPISLAIDIIDDLRALAPIADAIENASEIANKEPIRILSRADQIITICNDVSSLSIDGLDLRKKKLLSKFVKQDLLKLAHVARAAYPEAFSPTTDNFGELVTNTLVDFAELLTAKARLHEDKLYADILALVSYQIAEYANYNEIRTKFDVLIKKNRINSNPKVFDNKIKMAWLRAVTYVPQIARHAQEISAMQNTNEFERRLIEKSLEILQLAYIEARDKYASYLQESAMLRVA